jgi:UDP-glucose 4-epimerase
MDVVDALERITGRRPSFIHGDVRDTALLQQVLEDHRIDAVVHFAALKVVGDSLEQPIEYYANNVQGTISLLQAMQATTVRTLVFSSSATVYGHPQYLPIDEKHPTAALTPYGRSKLVVEEMLADLVHSDSGWRVACMRYFNPVGAHESGLIGENPRGRPNNLMPVIVQVAAEQRRELDVFGGDYPTADGTGVRDYIHVMDVAEGHAAVLWYLAAQPGWHGFNLGTGRGYSVLEVVRSFERATGRPIPYRVIDRRPGDVAACYADPTAASSLLGWKAKRSLDDMCRSAWKFEQMTAVGA